MLRRKEPNVGWSKEDYKKVGSMSSERQAEMDALARAAQAEREGKEASPADIALAIRAFRRMLP